MDMAGFYRLLTGLVLSIAGCFTLQAQDLVPLVIPQDLPKDADKAVWQDSLISVLGYTIAEAVESYGAPSEMYAVRGTEAANDTIVYYYSDHWYLFWWQNRVWQIRFDKRYEGDIFGLRMGTSPTQVRDALGQPILSTPKDMVFQLPDRGYPVRLRLVFDQDKLVDLYLYRADF